MLSVPLEELIIYRGETPEWRILLDKRSVGHALTRWSDDLRKAAIDATS